MTALPSLMVAPNGARRKKADHPAIPVTVAEIVATAKACHQAGADGCHFHVRDAEQTHVLDVGLYREALRELALVVPDMALQVTTEAVGRYSPPQMRELVYDVRPRAVSVSFREMTSDGDLSAARQFYEWCREADVEVQHILYTAADRTDFAGFFGGRLSAPAFQLMFVLGSYTSPQPSRPTDLDSYLAWLDQQDIVADWATCAFGKTETECLAYAHSRGGKLRVGFENSIWNADGSVATSNAERVAEIVAVTSRK